MYRDEALPPGLTILLPKLETSNDVQEEQLWD